MDELGVVTQDISPDIATPLADWRSTIGYALKTEQYEAVILMVHVVLRNLPQHVPTYQHLVQLAWALKQWNEGEDWGRRLLQADPGNACAWRAIAKLSEERGNRVQAKAVWQRAFELAPYEPEVRAGLQRTSLDKATTLMLNQACLASLYLRGKRWRAAEKTYRLLLKADARRIDFQLGLLIALWQQGSHVDAYRLARHLVHQQPHLLMAWVALDVLGDANDRALASDPIRRMDPDYEFTRAKFGERYRGEPTQLYVNSDESELLTFMTSQFSDKNNNNKTIKESLE